MPCLAKLFNSILNTMLQKFLDTNKTMNHCHIGFQPKARTVDHTTNSVFLQGAYKESSLIATNEKMS